MDGSTCSHCGRRGEQAVSALGGVKAVVKLGHAVGAVGWSGPEIGLGEWQKAVTERAGE